VKKKKKKRKEPSSSRQGGKGEKKTRRGAFCKGRGKGEEKKKKKGLFPVSCKERASVQRDGKKGGAVLLLLSSIVKGQRREVEAPAPQEEGKKGQRGK